MAASENVPIGEGLRPPVVLVVEDVVLVRMLIAERLRSRGFDVVEAGDGAEAVRVLRTAFPCMRY
jgi:CheY-like chemotaxis protein